MYSFDIGAMPKLVKPFVPAGIAGAVVRPRDEAQVVRLAKYAQSHGVRLVPRGWATSGYGGVLPQAGAVVVDMSGHQRVLSVDAENLLVRVEAGAIWENIDREIGMHGLALRMYPSSYPSSSVAGWLAQGGSGFGSYEYGTFKENVTAARVVLPNGEVREFAGADLLDLVADAEGITGIITEIEFRVRAMETEVHRLVALEDTRALGGFLSAVSAQGLPVWSITFLNPESTRLKKQLPHHHGHPYEMAHEHFEPKLPEAYLAVIAYPESRRGAIDARTRADHRRQRRHGARCRDRRARVGAAVRADAAQAHRTLDRADRGRGAACRDARGARRDRGQDIAAVHSRGHGRQGRLRRAARLHSAR